MPENAVVERVSLVKSCLPAKAVVKTSPEFRPELTDWLLIRGRLDNSGFLFYSEERGEHIYKAQVPQILPLVKRLLEFLMGLQLMLTWQPRLP